jgi:hypothetical protein
MIGDRLAVGCLTLNQETEVRTLLPELEAIVFLIDLIDRAHRPTGRRRLRTPKIRVQLSVSPLEEIQSRGLAARLLVHIQATMVRLHPGLFE